ncbi:MAG TPA: SDR family NAD(P)-dependent oxidoreductase, partial [Ferruginibacter sp.]|nr:SDR family NAD(P)-dependent oxidoreductase [Ferruginibacter sp.]
MFSLKNKKAIITGAGSGIGKAIAVLFAKQGAEVHILEINAAAASEVIIEINVVGGKAFA